MIWTTTPWTLPANLAIAVHEKYRYALVEIDGNTTIMASDLVASVARKAGAEKVVVRAETDGAKLVGLAYRHPFCPREGRVVAAEYVTLEDGTGLVHTAPGHGADDYRTGLKEGLPAYCPVREDGTYDDTVPEWLRGKSIWTANAEVAERLRASGHLFYDHKFMHSYPHDWRSKTPVIFRATEQWFVGVDVPVRRDGKTLRQRALEAITGEVGFTPEWGRNRLRGMLESRPDWCISRQRSWGLPIPAFRMADGKTFLTPASVRAVAKRGSWSRPPISSPTMTRNPTRRRPRGSTSRRSSSSTTSSTSGSRPEVRGTRCCARAASAIRPRCTSRAATSTAGGSSFRCCLRSERLASRRSSGS
jgi:isoleucyl-tRNA synthetase